MAEIEGRKGRVQGLPIRREEVVDFLGSIPLMQQLPGASVQKIAEVVEPLHFGKGEILVREGSPGEGLYYLWKGEAEVSESSTGGVVGPTSPSLKPGDYFGVASPKTLHKADVTALTECFVNESQVSLGHQERIQTLLDPEEHTSQVISNYILVANVGYGMQNTNYPMRNLIQMTNFSGITMQVTCFVLRHENADLLSSVSIWSKQPEEGCISLIERILHLETLEVDLYRGYTYEDYPSFGGNVYGGQLVGQALAAASKSVDPLLLVHSLHSYFLRTGDDQLPIIYKVERTRDGHTFATRQVCAMQKGKTIFTLYASFQRHVEGLEHQEPMPSTPSVDQRSLTQIPSWEEVQKSYLSDPRIPLKTRQALADRKSSILPLDLKYVEPVDHVQRQVLQPWQRVWIKSKGKLSDDEALQRCAAAYISDWTFLETTLRPHRHLPGRGEMQILSLDHSMWFHKPFRADEWLLFVQRSPRASNGRGLVFGHFYTESGELVMSASQEGMLRKAKPELAVKSKL